MARAGIPVDETIVIPGISGGTAAGEFVRVMGLFPEYSSSIVGRASYRFSRRRHPTWAIIAACLTAPLAGVGLLLLLVRRAEECVIAVADDDRGATLRLSGTVRRHALVRLRALGTSVAQAAAAHTPAAVVSGGLGLAENVRRPPRPRPSPSALGPLIDEVPGARTIHRTAAASDREHDTTWIPRVIEAPVVGGAEQAPSLVFDTGRTVVVNGVGLVGRDPAGEPGEHVDHLVSIDDPQRSISKTHFQFGADVRGVWLVDRHSTNGCVVRERDGRRRTCRPGAREYLLPGSVVAFGEREFRVQRGEAAATR